MYAARLVLCSLLLVPALLSGCATRAQHEQALPSVQEREMTVGLVQKEIHDGMAQADVVTVLGSPNIVTKDSDGKETWVYDKIATEASYSKSDRYGTILILGGSAQAGAYSSTQRTLTVIIKFNDKSQVESFTYHASKF